MEEINRPDLSGMQKKVDAKNNKISSSKVDNENPQVILGTKSRKITIIVLVILLALVLAATSVAVFVPPASSPNEIYMDISVSFDLSPIKADVPLEPGEKIILLPGDSLTGSYAITSTAEDINSEVFIRVKIYSIVHEAGIENYYDNLFTFDYTSEEWRSNWMMAADGYIYLRKTLKANSSVEVTNKLTLSKDLDNSLQGKKVTIYFLAEALQAGEGGQQAIASIWETAPSIWRDEILSN